MSRSDITWSPYVTRNWWRCEVNTPVNPTTKEQLEKSLAEQCETGLNSQEQLTGVPPAIWEQARQKAKDNVSTMVTGMISHLAFPLSSWTGTVECSIHEDRPRVVAVIKTAGRRVSGSATEHEGRVVNVS